MKKTLVALSVLAAATSAQAIELYNQDGVTVGMHGDIEVVYMQKIAVDSEFKQYIEDADFGFDVRYAINDDVQFGAYWEFNGAPDDDNSDKAVAGDTYVALYSNSLGSIKAGRLCTVFDDAGIGSDFQFGISSFFDHSDAYCIPEAVRYDLDKGNFYVSAAFAQNRTNNTTGLGQDGSHTDAKLGYRVADFDFTLFLGETKAEDDTAGQEQTKESLWALEGRYAGIENLELALGYYVKDGNLGEPTSNTPDIKTDTMAAAATYTMDKVVLAAGYSVSDSDEADFKNIDKWYVNAGYALAPNTTAYVEVGASDEKDNLGRGTDTGVAVGVKAEF